MKLYLPSAQKEGGRQYDRRPQLLRVLMLRAKQSFSPGTCAGCYSGTSAGAKLRF